LSQKRPALTVAYNAKAHGSPRIVGHEPSRLAYALGTTMSTAHVWTGQEILHLTRFRNLLCAASQLVGHDDFLANLLLEDALEELRGVIGDHAKPIAEESVLRGRCTLRCGAAHRRRRQAPRRTTRT
jgi:hypothetical protein